MFTALSNKAFAIDTARLDWNLLRVFLFVVDTRSMSSAAQKIGTSQATVSRQIDALETAIGAALFERTTRGLRLTETGERLVPATRQMMDAALQVGRTLSSVSEELSGIVRITACDAVCAYMLPPLLTRLMDAYPDIHIELVNSNQEKNLVDREADVALCVARPTQTVLISKKLGDWPLRFYAHELYLQRFGLPRTPFQSGHRWVGFEPGGIVFESLEAQGYASGRDALNIRCDNLYVGWQMVAAGLGVGLGVAPVVERCPSIVPVLTYLSLPSFPVWLTSHRELRNVARIRLVFDFLAQALAVHGDSECGADAGGHDPTRETTSDRASDE